MGGFNFISFLTMAVRVGMSFLYGSTGETITEKAGHLNLGIPGIMFAGAATGCVSEAFFIRAMGKAALGASAAAASEIELINAGYECTSALWIILVPLIATFIGGALVGLIYSFLTVTLRANQNVTGLALTMLGTGLAKFIIKLVPNSAAFSNAKTAFTVTFPFADKLGWFSQLFFSYGVMIYLAIVVALIASFVLMHTRVGLNLRAIGENPATADAAGINVIRYKYLATCIGSGIAGWGGLCYIMDNLNGGWEYSIDAIGWLAIALVIFTLWRPNIAIIGSILFGGLYIAASYIVGIDANTKHLVKMLPYAVTILVLIVTSITQKKENQPPESLGIPYFREDR